MISLENIWTDEAKLGRIFTWLSRIGAGRHFGQIPIGWYQIHQCHCLDIIKEKLGPDNEMASLRCKNGFVQALIGDKWTTLTSAANIFSIADDRSRKPALTVQP